jgi:hypothetical protein
MYICIYVYMYIYIYMCVCVCLCVSVSAHLVYSTIVCVNGAHGTFNLFVHKGKKRDEPSEQE